jgi:hypothetical protein
MADETAEVARLMKVIEALGYEPDRQGFSDVLVDRGLDVTELAKAVIKAAAGDVVPFPCVYRKLKHGRSGDEVRPGWRVN